jgi:hypothetical protein
VRVDPFANAAAFSSVPQFLKLAVIPVARKLWLPSLVAMPVVERGQPSHKHSHAAALVRVSFPVPRPDA